MKIKCERCHGTGNTTAFSGASYTCDSCCGVGFLTSEPEKVEDPHWIKKIEKTLGDVEYYSPTMPMTWQWYHESIRKLIAELRKPPTGHGEGI